MPPWPESPAHEELASELRVNEDSLGGALSVEGASPILPCSLSNWSVTARPRFTVFGVPPSSRDRLGRRKLAKSVRAKSTEKIEKGQSVVIERADNLTLYVRLTDDKE